MPASEGRRRFHGEDGANLVEYAMLVTLIFLVALGAISYFADETTETFDSSSTAIRDADG